MSARTKSQHLQALVATAMLSAVALVLMLLEFPLLPAAPYLKMDFSDVPAVLAGVLFGPVYGVLTELLKNLLEMLIKGIGTQMGFGNLQNFLIGCSYVLPFTLIYRRGKKKGTRAAASLALASGVSLICMLVVGFLSNLAVAPLFFSVFMGDPLGEGEALAAAVISLPFNLIKGLLLIVISLLLVRLLLRAKPLQRLAQLRMGTKPLAHAPAGKSAVPRTVISPIPWGIRHSFFSPVNAARSLKSPARCRPILERMPLDYLLHHFLRRQRHPDSVPQKSQALELTNAWLFMLMRENAVI